VTVCEAALWVHQRVAMWDSNKANYKQHHKSCEKIPNASQDIPSTHCVHKQQQRRHHHWVHDCAPLDHWCTHLTDCPNIHTCTYIHCLNKKGATHFLHNNLYKCAQMFAICGMQLCKWTLIMLVNLLHYYMSVTQIPYLVTLCWHQ